jgi:hypothetical protein
MPDEFYFVVGSIAIVAIAFAWLRGAARKRIENPQRDDDREIESWRD